MSDTTTSAVERLAKTHDEWSALAGKIEWSRDVEDASMTAATLRALAAERDRLREAVAWTMTADALPQKPGLREYEQVECLIMMQNGDIVLSMWNCEHECWDDAEGDDYRFDPLAPKMWLSLTAIRQASIDALTP